MIERLYFRPCIIFGRKALFHRWVERQSIVAPSPMVGGHTGGIVKTISALVEFEDGTCTLVNPEEIKFVDDFRIKSMFNQYKKEYEKDD